MLLAHEIFAKAPQNADSSAKDRVREAKNSSKN